MKTRTLFALAAATALCSASFATEEKTVGEKSAEVWDETKEKTKQATKAVVQKTKEAVAAVEHRIDKPDPDARKVPVQVSDEGVMMEKKLPPGKTAFIVKNSGKQKHNFKISGEGLDESFWFSIAPGKTKTMQVELKKGRYESVCSVDGHAGKEGKTDVIVR